MWTPREPVHDSQDPESRVRMALDGSVPRHRATIESGSLGTHDRRRGDHGCGTLDAVQLRLGSGLNLFE